MDINIEKIMDDIRTEIKEKGYTSDMLSFSEVVGFSGTSKDGEFSAEEYKGVVTYLKNANTVPVSMPLKGNPIIVFIKKVIRRLFRVALRPVAEHQTEYNACSARAFAMVGNYIEQNSAVSNAQLLERIDLLELKLQTASKEIERLNAKIAENESAS